MSKPLLIIPCDQCNRTAARFDNGEIVLFQHHDKEIHETRIDRSDLMPNPTKHTKPAEPSRGQG